MNSVPWSEVLIALIIISFWFFLGWVISYDESYIDEVELKAASCYQEFDMDTRTGDKYLTVDYCGGKK
jgi:hypothetical protein